MLRCKLQGKSTISCNVGGILTKLFLNQKVGLLYTTMKGGFGAMPGDDKRKSRYTKNF